MVDYKATATKIWLIFVVGEALSPLKFSQENTKSLFWNIEQCWFMKKIVREKRPTVCKARNVKWWTTKQIWRIFDIGEALSPLKFSQENAKSLFWNIEQCSFMKEILGEKTNQLSAKRQMSNDGLHLFTNCYKNMAHFCCWWGAFTTKVYPKKMRNHCLTCRTMQSHQKIHLGTIHQLSAKR